VGEPAISLAAHYGPIVFIGNVFDLKATGLYNLPNKHYASMEEVLNDYEVD